jgi:hypothetical protein
MPEQPHLSGLQRGERCPDLPGRETGAAGVATTCCPHGATGYLAAERRCAIFEPTMSSHLQAPVRVSVVLLPRNVGAPAGAVQSRRLAGTNKRRPSPSNVRPSPSFFV